MDFFFNTVKMFSKLENRIIHIKGNISIDFPQGDCENWLFSKESKEVLCFKH